MNSSGIYHFHQYHKTNATSLIEQYNIIRTELQYFHLFIQIQNNYFIIHVIQNIKTYLLKLDDETRLT